MPNPFVQYDNVIPLLAPVDVADTNTVIGYMDVKNATSAAFLVLCGLLTSSTALDYLYITVEAATAVDGTEASIAFKYRKANAVGANVWGAVTSASDISLYASVDDGVSLWIEVDPQVLAASDYRYVRVRANPTDLAATLIAGVGFLGQRYRMTTMTSATASASA